MRSRAYWRTHERARELTDTLTNVFAYKFPIFSFSWFIIHNSTKAKNCSTIVNYVFVLLLKALMERSFVICIIFKLCHYGSSLSNAYGIKLALI